MNHNRNGRGPDRQVRKTIKKEITTEFLLLFYEAFLREYEITKVALALDTSAPVLLQWIRRFPELQEARTLAEQRRKQQSTFAGYVFKHLSPEAKRVWQKIQFWESADSIHEKIDQILSGQPTRLRQELFVHALIHYSFNLSEACRIACVSRQTLERWRKDDYEFLQMLEEIEWHKCNFFESSLIDLVALGNPGAVMYVNRTRNADRGYSEKIQVEHSGSLDTSLDLDSLNLPLEIRKQILTALRDKKAVIDIAPAARQLPETV